MTSTSETIRAADHLVDLLVAQGTDRIFGVPGESYLPVLDALHGRDNHIRYVTFRHEGGAAMAADAYGSSREGLVSAWSRAGQAPPMPVRVSISPFRIRHR